MKNKSLKNIRKKYKLFWHLEGERKGMGKPEVHALPLMSNLNSSVERSRKPPQRLRACQKQKQLVPCSLNGALRWSPLPWVPMSTRGGCSKVETTAWHV